MKLTVPAALLLTSTLFASSTYFSVPASDAPELAARGPYDVGVRTVDLVHFAQTDILHFDKATGKAPNYDRPLTIEVWYPAQIPAGTKAETVYKMPLPATARINGSPVMEIPDKALRDAEPLTGKSFPLVIVSHGYPGSRFFLSYLTSNLASKGYIVAAIDHTDSVFDAQREFPSTLINRSRDQLFTINSLIALASEPEHSFLHGIIDANNVAVVGYSMGGYGALTTAGAGYSEKSNLMKLVPGDYLKPLAADSEEFKKRDISRIKAIVAIAPWGNQPPFNAWDAEGVANIKIPSLFIAGDHDDVADYTNGIRPAFEEAIHSERCILVYENARHNTGGNPPPSADLPFPLTQAFDEPAWRKERITGINQHFITAFLDLYLKGDQAKAAYLHVLPEKSNDGIWAVPPMTPDKGAFSTGKDDKGNLFWKGFQRRDALGLQMNCKAAQ